MMHGKENIPHKVSVCFFPLLHVCCSGREGWLILPRQNISLIHDCWCCLAFGCAAANPFLQLLLLPNLSPELIVTPYKVSSKKPICTTFGNSANKPPLAHAADFMQLGFLV